MDTNQMDNLIEYKRLLLVGCISYLETFSDDPESLIQLCSDNAITKQGKAVKGVKFPLSIVAEALANIERLDDRKTLTQLRKSIIAFLGECYEKSGFNYFEESYLPDDLDTASSLTRVLSGEFNKIKGDYEEINKKNRFSKWVTPTWLGIRNHDQWFVGKNPFHIDVLLNYWLTEFQFGRPVDVEVITKNIASLGTKNYWYIPPLYTTFLLCKLLDKLELYNNEFLNSFILKNISTLHICPESLIKNSSSCDFPKILDLVNDQILSSPLNRVLELGVRTYLEKTIYISHNLRKDEQELLPILSGDWNCPIYWSLGFSGFSSEPVSKAIAIICLTEFSQEQNGEAKLNATAGHS